MTTIRVSALDTAQAMDEIIAKLGADALIIDTIKRNGKIEMTATDDPGEHTGIGEEAALGAQVTKILPYQTHRRQAGDRPQSTAEAMAEMQRAEAEIMPRFNEIFDQKMVSPPFDSPSGASHETGHPSPANHARRTAAPDSAALYQELAEIKKMLNGMMITQPDGLKEQLGHTVAVRLRQAGFSPEIIFDLQNTFEGQPFENGQDNFIEAIAGRLVRADTDDLLKRRLICVVGGSGAGKTTLATKIAAYCKEHAIVDRIMLGAVTGQGVSAGDEIKDFARLMNMKSVSFGIDELSERIHETSYQMIVDVSASPERALEAISTCCRDIGTSKVGVIQALPGGSSATMIKHQCTHYADLDPMIALTKLDECEAMPPELSALATHGAGIGLLTGTKSIVGGIAIATSQILTQYLRENV